MKKYLNKGLLYEWFNAAKVPIIMGLITWGFIANCILKGYVRNVADRIGNAESSSFYSADLGNYFILGIVFLAIYIFAAGVSKRNTTMFLCSGPYTKKQIKINELICLLITLVLFIIMYLYIAATIYVRNIEFMSIVYGYPQVMSIEVIRLLLFGAMGILLMLIVDLLFSNSIMAYFGIVALTIATMCIYAKISMILNYFGNYMFNISLRRIIRTDDLNYVNILFFQGPYNNNEAGMILKSVIILIVIILMMLILFNILEKKSKLETSNKIFTNKTNENSVVIYLSLGIGAFMNIIIYEVFLRNELMRIGRQILNSEIAKMLTIDVISIAVISFISYKIIKKFLRTIG